MAFTQHNSLKKPVAFTLKWMGTTILIKRRWRDLAENATAGLIVWLGIID